MDLTFLLNGESVELAGASPTRTLLDFLRETRSLHGTKEGCNEGDCGACTVMVTTPTPDGGAVHQALNACILFLPQLQGRAVRTVEGLAAPDGTLHPVQQAMVTHHGSQCGFCTPGIVMSLATAQRNGDRRHDDVLAGNLCRCTGYAPIIRAAEAAAKEPAPNWLDGDLGKLADLPKAHSSHSAYRPTSVDDLANWYAANPDATLVGGATDVGLWVTKRLMDLPKLCFVGQVPGLADVTITEAAIELGAAVNLNTLQEVMADHHPDFAEMIRRYGSAQVRGAATIGGNIANGSPIGDGPPALIALGARVVLRRGAERRDLPLEEFFLAYGKQDRAPGEFVERIVIPRQQDALKCYKISKRFDQDISALCGCFNIQIEKEHVVEARIAFGGMAVIPKRATGVERALRGSPWDDASVARALLEFDKDFRPIDDMRASAKYRMQTAKNLLLRYFAETRLDQNHTRVLEVSP